MNAYTCLKRQVYTSGNLSLIPLREEDMTRIRLWRNGQMEVLRQSSLLGEDEQKRYYLEKIWPCFGMEQPPQVLFSYLEGQECIGYGGLTNIRWDSLRTELSFLLKTELAQDKPRYQSLFESYLDMIKQVVFDDLEFNRIFTETFDIRPLHIKILENAGFKREGVMKEHVQIGGKFIDSIIHGYLREYYGRVQR